MSLPTVWLKHPSNHSNFCLRKDILTSVFTKMVLSLARGNGKAKCDGDAKAEGDDKGKGKGEGDDKADNDETLKALFGDDTDSDTDNDKPQYWTMSDIKGKAKGKGQATGKGKGVIDSPSGGKSTGILYLGGRPSKGKGRGKATGKGKGIIESPFENVCDKCIEVTIREGQHKSKAERNRKSLIVCMYVCMYACTSSPPPILP